MNNDRELMRTKMDAIRKYSGSADLVSILDYLLHDRGMDVSVDDLPLIIDRLGISEIPQTPIRARCIDCSANLAEGQTNW